MDRTVYISTPVFVGSQHFAGTQYRPQNTR